jgi:chaperone BCS1
MIRDYLGHANPKHEAPAFEFLPTADDSAQHRLKFRGRTIWFSRTRQAPMMSAASERPFVPEMLTLTAWGRDSGILKALLAEALRVKLEAPAAAALSVFVQSSSSHVVGWELALTKAARAADSIILDGELARFLLDDARRFLGNAAWYAARGVPHRRGYLLHGAPGCGKTTFAQVLASELQLDLCLLNLTHDGLNDAALAELMREAPRKAMIVLEDVDAVFADRRGGGGGLRATTTSGSRQQGAGSSVSFSGLLNALDGVASQEGRIIYLSTNHLDRLDPALVRPGRCDIVRELYPASREQARRMFLRFHPVCEADGNGHESHDNAALAAAFATRLPERRVSMAALQSYFLDTTRTPAQCVERAHELLVGYESVSEVSPHEARRRRDDDRRRRTPIARFLLDFGLERYARAFRLCGVTTVGDLGMGPLDPCSLLSILAVDSSATVSKALPLPTVATASPAAPPLTLSDLEAVSVALRYDPSARALLSRLVRGEVAALREGNAPTVNEAQSAFCAAFAAGGRFDGNGADGDAACGGDDEVEALSRAFCDQLAQSSGDSTAVCVLDIGRDRGAADAHLVASQQGVRALIDAYATQHCSSSSSSSSQTHKQSTVAAARACVAAAGRFSAALSARRRATESTSAVLDSDADDADELATVEQYLARAGLLDGCGHNAGGIGGSSTSSAENLVARFAAAGVVELDQLLALGGNKAAAASGAYADCLALLKRAPFELEHARAASLAEVLTRTPTARGALARFERTICVPHLRAEIASEVRPMVVACAGALSRGREQEQAVSIASSTADDDDFDAACTTSEAAAQATAQQMALSSCDWSGRARASIQQVSAVLRRHGHCRSDAATAAEAARGGLRAA